jgi:uncharacterized membrane protein
MAYADFLRCKGIGGRTMSFAIYTLGTLILLAGLVYVAHLVHMPERWIVAGVLLILGAGIMGGVSSTRQKDPS